VGDKSKRQRVDRLTRTAVTLAAVIGLTGGAGCKTFSDYTRATRTALSANDHEAALSASNRALGVKRAEQLPERLEGDEALLLLDRAMVLQVLHEFELSSRDFQVADKALEILDFSRSSANEIVRYMFSDSAGPYKARPYEKLMLNTINMINYLANQNLEGAKVEARRFAIIREYLLGDANKDGAALGPAGVPGSYLAGFAFEKAGNPGEALRYYDEALQAAGIPSLGEPIRRLTQISGYRTPRLEQAASSSPSTPTPEDESGEILIVINYGRVPALVAKRVPIGLALTVAAAFLPRDAWQQANRLAAQGLVTWINYPELAPTRADYPAPLVTIDGVARAPEEIANVDAIVHHAWDDSKGRVMAAAVTRMLTRAAVGAGVGVAAGKGSGHSEVGVLASMIAQASMAAADKPDTRSWATLPARIAVARMRLPAGKHAIQVDLLGHRHVLEATIEPKQWLVLDITDLSTL